MSGKNSPGKKAPRKKATQKIASPENYPHPRNMAPGKLSPGDCPLEKYPLGKLFPGKIFPEKLFYSFSVAVDIILQLFLLKLFIVTSFRGVCRTPATSTIHPCEWEFSLKKGNTKINHFEHVFQEFLPQMKKQILCRTSVLQNNHYTKLPLAVCATFLFSKFVCIWLLILHARIQFLKESWAAAIESFSTEFTESIVQKCSKKKCFRNIGGTHNKTPIAKYNIK